MEIGFLEANAFWMNISADVAVCGTDASGPGQAWRRYRQETQQKWTAEL